MRWSIDHGDCREILRDVADNSLDACVTDPPYGLEFMGKGWDAPWKRTDVDGFRRADNAADAGRDNAFGRASKRAPEYKAGVGFQLWCEEWAREVLRVLKPGGHLLAFGGTRTVHRLACAIEDAGFEVRDQIDWLYGSGFPKSLNLPEGLGTALKPGHEPIVLARKPLIGTVAANVAAHGTGALRIDGCRIATTDDLNGGAYYGDERKRDNYSSTDTDADASLTRLRKGIGEYVQPAGRWPANVIFDEDAAAELDEQSGIRTSGKAPGGLKRNADKFRNTYAAFAGQEVEEDPTYGDTGGASRFFYVAKAPKRERNTGCAVGNNHPTVKPVALMRYLVRLVTPKGGIVLDPFCGSGTTGVACVIEGLRFAGIEQNAEYIEIARQRITSAEEETPLLNRASGE